ncbi:tudor domain-containing protein 7B-like [Lingula anatina]|uniref:Tudor domain-containing protein 7B-like n=1 Tax=Lingula anatina TaxID=7574 RepID=A0A1S3JRB5_LINAN|nr:tudor domain-containing protein 7B-like [Lingula anatina]|eukprot:XP_013412925.1 tudor domain-containing protein 7B-like [Lingula anatina]
MGTQRQLILAVSCSLEGLEDLENNEIVLEKLYDSVLGITCVAEVHERGHTICVTLFDTSGAEDVNLNQALAGCVKDEDLTPKLPEDDEQVEGYVSHIADNGSIYFQMVGQGLERLNELMQEAGEYYSKVIDSTSEPPAVEIFIPGEENEDFLHSINQLLLSEPEIFMPDDICSDTVDEDVLQESQTDISLNQSSYSDEPDNSLYITVDEFGESAISDLPNMDANSAGSEESLSLNNNTDVKNQNASSDGVASERHQSTSSSLGEISAGGDGLCCQLTVLSLEDCDTLPRPPLLQIPKPGDYLDVHVSLVFNPGNFVCVPYESMEETLELMAQMSVFYTKVPNAKVSIDKVKPGDLLAGVLEGVWYRVEVRALVGEQVSVYFVDYGDFSIMSPEDLQPLPAHFRYMPFQAVKAKLAGVRPLGGRDWSKAAKDRFIELANEKDLVGLICNDKDSDRVAIRLIDTSQEGVDLTIDSVLVEEGLVERK